MVDLKSLAVSIQEEGLLQPIGVTEKLHLVFGERRLRATKDILKKRTILALCGIAAVQLNRKYQGIDSNTKYRRIAEKRIATYGYAN